MASKRKQAASQSSKKKCDIYSIPNLNVFDVGNVDIEGSDDISDVDENALESELEAILSGKTPVKPTKPKMKVILPVDVENCLKDSEEDDDDDDSLLLDPDLLKELQSLTCDSYSEESNPPYITNTTLPDSVADAKTESVISILDSRLQLYNEAVAAAKSLHDTTKLQRYNRAIKTLENLLKCAKAGKAVNEDDIPPIVIIPKAKNVTQMDSSNKIDENLLVTHEDPATIQISHGNKIDENLLVTHEDPATIQKSHELKQLMLSREEYKRAALQAKKSGDKVTALNCMKKVKMTDNLIEAMKNVESVELKDIPLSPIHHENNSSTSNPDASKEELQSNQISTSEALTVMETPENPDIFASPPAPSSILEALEQRLEKYNSTKAAAVAEGNSSKVRRLQRIVKSYESAIKDYKAGKTIDFEELPTPPGFAPIPVSNQEISGAAQKDTEKTSKPMPSLSSTSSTVSKTITPDAPKQHGSVKSKNKQLEFLLERQKLFRQAAFNAKQNGDIQQAKEYLRMSKGFDAMIEATKCGLPIDGTNIPTPPQLQSDFEIVEISDCLPIEEGSTEELLETLEKDLMHQIEVCSRNKEHFLRLGDVSSASKFEKLGLESRKDLSVVQHTKKSGGATPKFHYETRLFSIVQCHPELSDNELEVTVERGINLPGKPDDLDSYVKLDLPIPSNDAPQRAKTHTIRDTNNPIFQEEFKFEINRKSRAQLRQFKRQSLKLEVWSKGGFLRSDTLLGIVFIKLADLETKCTIHDCFDLMDGRKASGGKIQVKLRVRDPLMAKQVEEVREKWLVIGS